MTLFSRADGRASQVASVKMHGTTLCPYCNTRFQIDEAQFEGHLGMARCAHCQQTFAARFSFAPDQDSPQLELPMLDLPVLPAPANLPILQPMTLAEQVAIVEDEVVSERQPQPRTWPWVIAVLLMVVLLLSQLVYFFRVELAARMPDLKPAFVEYCRILKCTISLPQKTDLIGIESSELEGDPKQENQVSLNALLRNRAPFAQAFPNLELTLNDSQDKPLARRVFRPADYLPPQENEAAGMQPNHELILRLHLNTGDLRPIGYRLVLFYPDGQAR